MIDSLFSVQDQVVLVSGGSRGIGKAIAAAFAERGARVVITGRDLKVLEAAAAAMPGKHPVQPIVCDVLDSSAITRLVDGILREHSRIDTLVNVAGVNRRKPTLEVTEEDFDFVTGINVKGAFLVSQAVGRAMVSRGSGNQINIASLNSDRPLKNVLPYAMSKSAVAHMTRGLALEWGSSGVRVNAIAPGFVLTDLTRKLWSDEGMAAWGRANIPQGRIGQPEDMIGAAIFLASSAATYVTGQILYVDGGFTAGWAWPIPAGGGQ